MLTLLNEKMPAICAHRGLSALCPENSLPAFGAAVALGADEIELDVRLTKDGELIVSHDEVLERVSNGTGTISAHTLQQAKALNIGGQKGWDVSFCTPQEVFCAFGGKTIINLHLKEAGPNGALVQKLYALILQYKLQNSVYFATHDPEVFTWLLKLAPEIDRCAIQLPEAPEVKSLCLQYQCRRVQFWRGMYDEALIKELHAQRVLCNLYYSDDAADMQHQLAMGIDVLLTNRADIAVRALR